MENTSGVSKSMGIGFASSTQVGPVIPPDLNGPVGQPTESPPDQGGIFINFIEIKKVIYQLLLINGE